MSTEKTLWEKAVDFHGHSCPGLAIGFKVSEIALEKLNEMRAPDEELVAIVENDACSIDAVMFVTGCTMGKGNLLYRDMGKQVYTFGSRNSNRALRIAVDGEILHRKPDPETAALRERVFSGQATPEEHKAHQAMQAQRTKDILNMPKEKFCKVEEIEFKFPSKAKIFGSVKCSSCGEMVMEPRSRVQQGQFVCLDCFEDYTRIL